MTETGGYPFMNQVGLWHWFSKDLNAVELVTRRRGDRETRRRRGALMDLQVNVLHQNEAPSPYLHRVTASSPLRVTCLIQQHCPRTRARH
jgi:hypothetical protein